MQQIIVLAIINATAHAVALEVIRNCTLTAIILVIGALVAIAAFLAGKPAWFAPIYRRVHPVSN